MLDDLRRQVEAATITFSHSVADRFVADGIYCVALYTSGDYRYVIGTFSTYKGLEEVAKQYLKYEQYEQEWRTVEKAMRELKWSPCDSPHHGKFDRLFKKVNRLVEKAWNVVSNDDEYKLTCQGIHEACIAALAAARKSGIFDEDVVLNLLMGDQSDEERLLNAEELNAKPTLNKLKGELDINAKRLAKIRRNRWDW